MSLNVDGAKVSKVTPGEITESTGVVIKDKGAIVQRCIKVTVDYRAMAGASTTTVTLWTPPARTLVKRVLADVRTVFTGGSLSAMTAQVGVSGTTNKYLLANSVLSSATQLGDVVAEMGAGVVDATRADALWASTAIIATFTATSDNCNAATQGVVDFYLIVETLP